MFTYYRKGEIAHLKVQLRAAEKGVVVAIPTVEQRYDLILDDGSKLHKVQVKYGGCMSGSAVQVDLRRQTRNRGLRKTYSSSEVDSVLVYLPKIDKICWLQKELFHDKKCIMLRWEPALTKNGRSAIDVNEVLW